MSQTTRLHLLGGLRLERDDARAAGGAAMQRKRLALLAVIARTGARGVSRDRLLALLWPDHAPDEARHALDVALSAIRRALPDGALVSGPLGVAVDPLLVSVDVTAFEAALAADDPRAAVGHYGGPFLDGVALPGAAEFGRWAEEERVVLARRYADALAALTAAARGAGDTAATARWAAAWAAADPLGARAAAALVAALVAADDRSAAARACRTYEALVRQELGIEPDPSVAAALASDGPPTRAPAPSVAATPPTVADRAAADHAARAADEPPAADRGSEATPPGPDARPRAPGRRALATAGASALVLAVVLAAAARGGTGGRRAGGALPLPPASGVLVRDAPVAAEAGDSAAPFWPRGAAPAADPRSAVAMARAAAITPDDSTRYELYVRAESLAAGAPLRERLLVRTLAGVVWLDAAHLAASDTLAARFPDDPDALAARADLLLRTGEYARVVAEVAPLVRRAALDRGRDSIPLNALYSALVESYVSLSALDDAERVAREWSARTPELPGPWDRLAHVLAARGRCAEADSALGAPAMRATALGRVRDVFRLACEEHYADAAAALGERVRHGTPDEREDARWWQVIAERYAGQLEAAARNARELADVPGTLYQHLLLEGQVAFESGRPREAASKFALAADRMTLRLHEQMPPGHGAARATAARAWGVTHVAVALAAAGELDRAWALTDTIAMLTRHEVSERGRALPHYARGVVLAARARREEAVNPAAAAALRETAIGELRQGLGHPVRGLVAARLTLGRLLTADGRAAEALAVLRPAAWRGLDDANRLYVSAPEVRLALAEAYDAAGQRDSAVAEYRRVLRAWRHADARFDARRAHAAARVARLARSVAVADAPRPTR